MKEWMKNRRKLTVSSANLYILCRKSIPIVGWVPSSKFSSKNWVKIAVFPAKTIIQKAKKGLKPPESPSITTLAQLAGWSFLPLLARFSDFTKSSESIWLKKSGEKTFTAKKIESKNWKNNKEISQMAWERRRKGEEVEEEEKTAGGKSWGRAASDDSCCPAALLKRKRRNWLIRKGSQGQGSPIFSHGAEKNRRESRREWYSRKRTVLFRKLSFFLLFWAGIAAISWRQVGKGDANTAWKWRKNQIETVKEPRNGKKVGTGPLGHYSHKTL